MGGIRTNHHAGGHAQDILTRLGTSREAPRDRGHNPNGSNVRKKMGNRPCPKLQRDEKRGMSQRKYARQRTHESL